MKIKLLDEQCKPYRAHDYDAGLDLKARETVTIPRHVTKAVPLGVCCGIPRNHVGLLFPRSSMGKTPFRMTNSVGVIDSDYRGEICAMYQNTSVDTLTIEKGERIAQLVIVPISIVSTEYVDELDSTERGTGGFGSTGKM